MKLNAPDNLLSKLVTFWMQFDNALICFFVCCFLNFASPLFC